MLSSNHPSCSQKELLNLINEVSFAVVELTLFLDTHPDNEQAIMSCVFLQSLVACFRMFFQTGHGKEDAKICGIMKKDFSFQ